MATSKVLQEVCIIMYTMKFLKQKLSVQPWNFTYGSARNNSWLLAIFWPILTFGQPNSILVGQFHCTFSMGFQKTADQFLTLISTTVWLIHKVVNMHLQILLNTKVFCFKFHGIQQTIKSYEDHILYIMIISPYHRHYIIINSSLFVSSALEVTNNYVINHALLNVMISLKWKLITVHSKHTYHIARNFWKVKFLEIHRS